MSLSFSNYQFNSGKDRNYYYALKFILIIKPLSLLSKYISEGIINEGIFFLSMRVK